jgi:hypothetical protein
MAMAPPPFSGPPKQKAEEKTRLADRGIVSRLRKTVAGFMDKDAPVELTARLLLIRPDSMVVALMLPADMLWVPTDIVVELDDGTTVEAEVIVDESTRFSKLSAGQVVRLALRLGHATSAKPQAVRLTSGRDLVIRIR